MDYKEKYEQAIEALRSLFAEQAIKHCDRVNIKDITNIFPELKESEDERIRKSLRKCFEWLRDDARWTDVYGTSFDSIFAWLEKRGEQILANSAKTCKDEQKPGEVRTTGYWNVRDIEQKPNYCHHEVDLSGCSEEYRKAYYDGWNNCNQQHAQLEAERKPAWSKEDSNMLEEIVESLKRYQLQMPNYRVELQMRWLKSLKERYAWKPSEEQMIVLRELINFAADHATEHWNNYIFNVLRELRNQLDELVE